MIIYKDVDGVLSPGAALEVAKSTQLTEHGMFLSFVLAGAKAQHQADIEVVRSVENIGDKEGWEYSDAPLHDILEDFRAKVLEALGDKDK